MVVRSFNVLAINGAPAIKTGARHGQPAGF
jgi:hypothetical protein